MYFGSGLLGHIERGLSGWPIDVAQEKSLVQRLTNTGRNSHFRDSTFSVTEAAGSVLIHELLAGKHTTRTSMIQTRSVQLLSQLMDRLPFQTDYLDDIVPHTPARNTCGAGQLNTKPDFATRPWWAK